MTPHKHADLIKAWADGAKIEERYEGGIWYLFDGYWMEREEFDYRIKPKEPVKRWQWVVKLKNGKYWVTQELLTKDELEADAALHNFNVVKRLEHTETEFEDAS